jgi:hypothetical protein
MSLWTTTASGGSVLISSESSGNGVSPFTYTGSSSTIDWSTKKTVVVKIAPTTITSNCRFQFQTGRLWGNATVGDFASSDKGIGFKISGTSLYLTCANGSAYNISGSSLATLTAGTEYVLILTSDGSGNLSCTLNGSALTALTGAPTTTSSSYCTTVQISLTNNSTTDQQIVYVLDSVTCIDGSF